MSTPFGAIINMPESENDPVKMLRELADSCGRTNDAGFWILISAAEHVIHGTRKALDVDGSTAEYFFWGRLEGR